MHHQPRLAEHKSNIVFILGVKHLFHVMFQNSEESDCQLTAYLYNEKDLLAEFTVESPRTAWNLFNQNANIQIDGTCLKAEIFIEFVSCKYHC